MWILILFLHKNSILYTLIYSVLTHLIPSKIFLKAIKSLPRKGILLDFLYWTQWDTPAIAPFKLNKDTVFFSEGSCWILALTIISASVVVGKILIIREEVRNIPDVTRFWANKRQDTLQPQVFNKYPQTAVAIIILCKSRQNLIISISCIWKAL